MSEQVVRLRPECVIRMQREINKWAHTSEGKANRITDALRKAYNTFQNAWDALPFAETRQWHDVHESIMRCLPMHLVRHSCQRLRRQREEDNEEDTNPEVIIVSDSDDEFAL